MYHRGDVISYDGLVYGVAAVQSDMLRLSNWGCPIVDLEGRSWTSADFECLPEEDGSTCTNPSRAKLLWCGHGDLPVIGIGSMIRPGIYNHVIKGLFIATKDFGPNGQKILCINGWKWDKVCRYLYPFCSGAFAKFKLDSSQLECLKKSLSEEFRGSMYAYKAMRIALEGPKVKLGMLQDCVFKKDFDGIRKIIFEE